MGTERTLLRGGVLYDGTGAAGRAGNLLMEGPRIADVNAPAQVPDAVLVEVDGLAVAPGFIDIHSHSDYTLTVDPRAMSQIHQGVSTEVVGNCGHGCCVICNPARATLALYGHDGHSPLAATRFDEYLQTIERMQPAVNVAALVPFGQLRLGAVGLAVRPGSAIERAVMARVVTESMEAGALGLSTGLEYAQESGADAAELAAVLAPVARAGGWYATHTRNRDRFALAAVAEALETARCAGVPLQISHLTPRAAMAVNHAAMAQVDAAREDGLDVAFDMHTRQFGFTHLKNVVPPVELERSSAALARYLESAAAKRAVAAHPNLISAVGDWTRVEIADCPAQPELEGATVQALADAEGLDAAGMLCRILAAAARAGDVSGPMVRLLTYDEELLAETYRHPLCAIGSDAVALARDGPLAGQRFHGAYTWVAWFLRRMVRERRVLTLAEGIHRLTGLPAARAGLAGRGRLERDACADVVVFDPRTVREHGTVADPNRYASGVQHLWVNGVHTLAGGQITGDRGGTVLRRRG